MGWEELGLQAGKWEFPELEKPLPAWQQWSGEGQEAGHWLSSRVGSGAGVDPQTAPAAIAIDEGGDLARWETE